MLCSSSLFALDRLSIQPSPRPRPCDEAVLSGSTPTIRGAHNARGGDAHSSPARLGAGGRANAPPFAKSGHRRPRGPATCTVVDRTTVGTPALYPRTPPIFARSMQRCYQLTSPQLQPLVVVGKQLASGGDRREHLQGECNTTSARPHDLVRHIGGWSRGVTTRGVARLVHVVR